MANTAITFSVSDGDSSHRPGPTSGREPATREEQVTYRSKVGELVSSSLPTHTHGLKPLLKALPEGYALYRYPRPGGSKTHVDKFLYGHPSNYIFNSTNDFKPHAIWLLREQEGSCGCNGCKKLGNIPKQQMTKQPKRVGRPPKSSNPQIVRDITESGPTRAMRDKPTAAEMAGTESIFTTLMTRLKQAGELDTVINDPDNRTFELEQRLFKPLVSMIPSQPTVPRLGELVLFHLKPNKTTEAIFWKAGLISELPTPKPPPLIDSHVTMAAPPLAISYTGFRVETMSDPNSQRKDEQLQWHYLPASQIKSFMCWPGLVDLEAETDASLQNALKCMASFSLVLPTHFKGQWPDAHIYFEGLYLGSELLVKDDYVNILPLHAALSVIEDKASEATVLKIMAAVLTFSGLSPDSPTSTRVSGDNCESIEVRVQGRLYHPNPINLEEDSDDDGDETAMKAKKARTEPLQGLQPIFSDETQVHSLPLTRIGGRHYGDSQASGSTPVPSKNEIADFITESRQWARQNDVRIHQLNADIGGNSAAAEWWWGNDRVEALGLDRFGDNDVGEKYERFLAKERMAYEG